MCIRHKFIWTFVSQLHRSSGVFNSALKYPLARVIYFQLLKSPSQNLKTLTLPRSFRYIFLSQFPSDDDPIFYDCCQNRRYLFNFTCQVTIRPNPADCLLNKHVRIKFTVNFSCCTILATTPIKYKKIISRNVHAFFLK